MATRDEVIRYVFEASGSKELEATARLLMQTGDASEETELALRGLADEFGRLAKESSALKAFAGEKARLADVTAQLDLARKGLDALNAEFSESDKSSTAVARAFAAAERSIAQLSTEQNRLQVQFAKTEGTLEKAGLDATNLAAAEQELARRSGEASLKVKELNDQVSRGGRFSAALKSATEAGARGFRALRESVNDVGASLLRITGITGAITGALGALSGARIFGGAVKSAREFGAVLSEVQAVSGATAEQLQRMKETAEAVSATTRFSATEAAQGLSELARATGSAEAAMQALPPTMQLAQAAGYGVAESATLVTTTLTQFGLAVDQAGRVADVLAKAANSTSADVQGLGNSLSYAAPLAKQLNLSFEETTAVIGALADQGFRGERAGTALRNVFSELLSPTSEFKQRLAALGIETDSFAGVMEGLAGAGDRGREAILALDAQARPAILALVSDGGKAIRSLEGDLQGAAGAAADTARTMGDNFESAWSRIVNAFDEARRALIDPLLAPFIAEIDNAAVRIREFVKSADFSRVKAAVSEFATGAARVMREFVESIDFGALAGNIRAFVGSAREALDSMSEKAGAIGATLQAVGSTISLFWNGLQAAVFTAAGVITGSFTAVSRAALFAAEGISKLNGTYVGLAPTFDSIREKLGGLEAVTEEFSRRATANASETKEAWNGLSDALGRSVTSTKAATAPLANLRSGLKVTAEQAERLRAQFDILPEHLQRIVAPGLQAVGVMVDVADAARKVADASADAGVAVERSQDRLDRAVQAYADLARSGTATAEQLHAAGVEIARASSSINTLGTSAEDAARRADDLKAAFATLGISSQRDLQATADAATIAFTKISNEFQAGVRPIEDVRAAFAKYAEAQLAAVANSDAWKQSVVADMLAVKAAALGLGDVSLPDFQKPTTGVQTYRAEVDKTRESVKQAANEAAQATDAMAAGQQQLADQQTVVTSSFAQAASLYAQLTAEFAQHSEAAAKRFQDLTWNLKEFGVARDGIINADVIGLAKFMDSMSKASAMVRVEMQEQRDAMGTVIQSWEAMDDAALAAQSNMRGGLEELSGFMRQQAEEARAGRSEFELLGATDLNPLISALDAAAQRVDALRQRTEQANEAFEDYAANARAQLDQLNGDLAGAEQRQHEREMENLREQAEAANALNSAEYNDAVQAAEALHRRKMEQIREQQEAQRRADEESKARAEEQTRRKKDEAEAARTEDDGPTTATSNDRRVQVEFNGKDLGRIDVTNAAELQRTAKALLPHIIDEIKRAARATGAFGR